MYVNKCKYITHSNLETTNDLPKIVLINIYDAMVLISSLFLYYLCSL